MVPKTGSSVLTAAFAQGCRVTKGNQTITTARIRFHNTLYVPCSVATLREPCERIVSQFEHLKARYSNPSVQGARHGCVPEPTPQAWTPTGEPHNNAAMNRTRAPGYGPQCREHWLHRTPNVSVFISQLRARWRSEVLPLDASNLGAHSTRHMIVLIPQHRWLGNGSLVVCSSQLSAQALTLARRLSCHGLTRTVMQNVQRAYDETRHQTNTSGSLTPEALWPLSSRMPGWNLLDQEDCRTVRELYAEDTRWWTEQCANNKAAA